MKAWEDFLSHLEDEFGKNTVDKWLKPLKIIHFDAANIYLQAEDSFQILWFEEYVAKKAKTRFLNNNQRPIKIHLSLNDNFAVPKKGRSKKEEVKPQFQIEFENLDPNLTFENYLSQDPNIQFLKSIDQKVQFNPIYIYGEKGTGKTHLLHGIAHQLKERGLKVLYSKLENFTDHVVNAIRLGEMRAFREAYRNTDVLLLDDVHKLSKKWATQEELFHTFNALHLSEKQIIVTSNCTPRHLTFIEPRLISRFEWGLMLQTHSLDPKDLKSMVAIKAKSLNFELSPKVIHFLLETFKTTLSICQALEALVLRRHLLKNNKTTLLAVHELLEDLIKEEQKISVTHSKVLQEVSEFFGIRIEDILSKAKSRDCTLPRQIAMYLCREQLKMPYTKIGETFFKDHSTVMTSVKAIQKALQDNEHNMAGTISAITRKLFA